MCEALPKLEPEIIKKLNESMKDLFDRMILVIKNKNKLYYVI